MTTARPTGAPLIPHDDLPTPPSIPSISQE